MRGRGTRGGRRVEGDRSRDRVRWAQGRARTLRGRPSGATPADPGIDLTTSGYSGGAHSECRPCGRASGFLMHVAVWARRTGCRRDVSAIANHRERTVVSEQHVGIKARAFHQPVLHFPGDRGRPRSPRVSSRPGLGGAIRGSPRSGYPVPGSLNRYKHTGLSALPSKVNGFRRLLSKNPGDPAAWSLRPGDRMGAPAWRRRAAGATKNPAGEAPRDPVRSPGGGRVTRSMVAGGRLRVVVRLAQAARALRRRQAIIEAIRAPKPLRTSVLGSGTTSSWVVTSSRV